MTGAEVDATGVDAAAAKAIAEAATAAVAPAATVTVRAATAVRRLPTAAANIFAADTSDASRPRIPRIISPRFFKQVTSCQKHYTI